MNKRRRMIARAYKMCSLPKTKSGSLESVYDALHRLAAVIYECGFSFEEAIQAHHQLSLQIRKKLIE